MILILNFFDNTANRVRNAIVIVSVVLQFFCQEISPGGHLASIMRQHIHREVMTMMLQINGAYTRTWIEGLQHFEVCMFN